MKESEVQFYNDTVYCNNADYVVKQINRNLSKGEIQGKVILDYGCGAGCVSFELLKQFPSRIDAIDLGKKNIEFANDKARKLQTSVISFYQKNLDESTLAVNHYDLIWSDTVIELMKTPLKIMIANFYAALHENGVLYISFTKNTPVNRCIFFCTHVLSILIPKNVQPLFYYLIVPTYLIATLFSRKGAVKIDFIEIRKKIKYLFTPYMRLLDSKKIERLLTQSGFQVIYCRERIKSDINSPPHIEVKAVKKTI